MERDHPDVLTFPPVLFVVGIAIGYGLERLLPMDLPVSQPWGLAIAGALALLGLALVGWAAATMLRARTGIDPYKPATALVTWGPFRFTRNPIYLAWLPLTAALCLATDTWWPLAMMAPVFWTVDRFVVRPEERYLAAKFGKEYDAYRHRVRRWL